MTDAYKVSVELELEDKFTAKLKEIADKLDKAGETIGKAGEGLKKFSEGGDSFVEMLEKASDSVTALGANSGLKVAVASFEKMVAASSSIVGNMKAAQEVARRLGGATFHGQGNNKISHPSSSIASPAAAEPAAVAHEAQNSKSEASGFKSTLKEFGGELAKEVGSRIADLAKDALKDGIKGKGSKIATAAAKNKGEKIATAAVKTEGEKKSKGANIATAAAKTKGEKKTKGANIATAAAKNKGVKKAKGAKKPKGASIITDLKDSFKVGKKIGTNIYNNMSGENQDKVGGTIATVLSWFGNEEAKDALAKNHGPKLTTQQLSDMGAVNKGAEIATAAAKNKGVKIATAAAKNKGAKIATTAAKSKGAKIATSAAKNKGAKKKKGTKKAKGESIITDLKDSYKLGKKIGTNIYNNMSGENQDKVGGTIATVLSWFGNEEAKEALAKNLGPKLTPQQLSDMGARQAKAKLPATPPAPPKMHAPEMPRKKVAAPAKNEPASAKHETHGKNKREIDKAANIHVSVFIDGKEIAAHMVTSNSNGTTGINTSAHRVTPGMSSMGHA